MTTSDQGTRPHHKVALVTGGAKRLGKAIALALADAGWDIAIHYGSSAQEAEETCADVRARGRRAIAIACDLADEAAVRRLLPSVIEQLGAVTCVVNNASLFEYDCAAGFSQQNLTRHMLVNLAAPILLAKALHAATADGDMSVVINLLDQKLYNMNPDFLSYTMSKASLSCATVMLAQELAPKVRVVGVAPGLTLISHIQTQHQFEAARAISPLGESSRPEEVAATVVFVAGNRGITGSNIVVDAGQHLIPLSRDFSLIHQKN